MNKSNNKGTNFLVQGSILAIASIISRVIGLIYRIPMTNIIGDLGNNYYGCAFDIYNVMLIISSYSLPLAVAKLVSEQMANGRRKMAYQVFKCAMLFAVIAGAISALIVYFGADFFTSSLLKTPNSLFALQILAPALIIVAVLGVIRGFFQGIGTMIPSAISQVIEQIVNAIVSVWAAYVLYQYGSKIGKVLGNEKQYAAAYGAAGGTLGTNLGSVAGLLFVLVVFMAYMKVFKRQMRRDRRSKTASLLYTFRILIATILPVLLSTIVYSIAGILDQGIFKNIALLQGYSENDIDIWWGVFSGKYKLMINVPISIASALAASSVPSLTAAYTEGDMDKVRYQINAAMRFIMIVALPCTVGLAVLARPIFAILFPGTIETLDLAVMMMVVGACAVVFYSVSTLSNGLLQGINRLKEPVTNGAFALVAHIVLLVVLMMFFRMNIYAVVIANAFLGLLMCFLNGMAIKKYSRYHQEIVKTFLIPGICSAIMGIICYLVYHGLYAVTSQIYIAFLAAFVIAVFVYAVSLLLLKGLTEDEIRHFPKGDRLVKIAKKFHLL